MIGGLIEGQDLIEFIDGSVEAPPNVIVEPERGNGVLTEIPTPQFKMWKRTNRLVKGWITSRLSISALSLVTDINTAKGVWDMLTSAYAHASVEREIMLRDKLQTIKKDTSLPI